MCSLYHKELISLIWKEPAKAIEDQLLNRNVKKENRLSTVKGIQRALKFVKRNQPHS